MTILNLCIVFLATGLWHGAAWTFVAWGALHGSLVVMERMLGWSEIGRRILGFRMYRLAAMLAVLLGWVLFRSSDVTYAWHYMQNMFGAAAYAPTRTLGYYFSPFCVATGAFALFESTGVFRRLPLCDADPESRSTLARMVYDIGVLVFFAASVCFLAGSTYNPFIYFRF